MRALLVVGFSLSSLQIYPAIPFWPAGFLLKNQLAILWEFPCMLLIAFPLVLLIFYFCIQFLLVWLMCVLSCFSLGLSCMWLSALHVISLNIFSDTLSSSSSSGIPITWMLVCSLLSQRSLRLSSFLFILYHSVLRQRFPLFYLPGQLSILLPQLFCYSRFCFPKVRITYSFWERFKEKENQNIYSQIYPTTLLNRKCNSLAKEVK